MMTLAASSPSPQQPVPLPPLDESSPRYPGWRVVFVCFVMATLCWGFGFYGHGFYLAELQRRHGWPASLIGGASTLYYLVSALLVMFINDAIRRFGVRACVLAAPSRSPARSRRCRSSTSPGSSSPPTW